MGLVMWEAFLGREGHLISLGDPPKLFPRRKEGSADLSGSRALGRHPCRLVSMECIGLELGAAGRLWGQDCGVPVIYCCKGAAGSTLQ